MRGNVHRAIDARIFEAQRVLQSSFLTMNIGILGGTFDPPHIGHLIIADQALAQLQLDEVWFMPVGQPPHKVSNHITPIHHRVAMVNLAIADHQGFRLSLVDVERPAPHYSSTALEILATRYPQHNWFFIMGADSLADLPRWHNPKRLIALAMLGVASRPSVRPDLDKLECALPGLRARVRWIDTPLIDIASSDLRQMAHAGSSLRYLVPHPVETYIKQHRLYRA
jgi:nicotinate-nucleotide adenylyltransferase